VRQALVGLGLGLMVGAVVGFAAATTWQTSTSTQPSPAAPPACATGATDAAVGVDAPEPPRDPPRRDRPPRPSRDRVDPPPRAERPPQDAKAASEDEPERPLGEVLRELTRAVRGDGRLTAHHMNLAQEISARMHTRGIDLALVDAALARSDGGDDAALSIAWSLAVRVPPDAAFRALREAVDGTHVERLRVAYPLADSAAMSSADGAALARRMMAHADAGVRSAGVALAAGQVEPPLAELVGAAQGDPDEDVRAEALESLLATVDWDAPDDGGRAVATSVTLLAARQGRGYVRETAISWLPEIGPPAADTAIALLAEGGLDMEMIEFVVDPILAAGRIDDLLAADASKQVLRAVGWWLDGQDLEPGRVRAFVPAIRLILRTEDEELSYSCMWVLAYGGAVDVLAEIAVDPQLDATGRTMALNALLSKEDLEEDLWDDAERRGVAALSELLRPERFDASSRRRTLQAFTEWDARVDRPGPRAEALVLLRRTATGDPSSWVRDEALEAIEMLEEYDEYE
jgi:hypothetical protein